MSRGPAEPPQPVTVTVARQVAPGREVDFEEFSEALTRAAARYPGFLGAGMLRPGHVGEPWHVVFRFDSPAHLHAWESSADRAELLAAADELIRSTDSHRVTGLETWFALPWRTAPAPPRWKMFLVTVCAIFLLQQGFTLALLPLGLPAALRILLSTVAVTATMTWLVMPRLARLLQDWLYAPPHRP